LGRLAEPEEAGMLKRLILKIVHTLATTLFSVLEVLGIPRVSDGKGREGER
jgi:hypothetical protein